MLTEHTGLFADVERWAVSRWQPGWRSASGLPMPRRCFSNVSRHRLAVVDRGPPATAPEAPYVVDEVAAGGRSRGVAEDSTGTRGRTRRSVSAPQKKGWGPTMMIAGIIAVCVILAVLAFFLPRLSRHAEQGTQKTLGLGSRAGGKAPGPLGRLLSKPFSSSSKAVDRSGSLGRRMRGHMPF